MAAEPVRAPALHIRPYHADRDRAGRPGISGGQGVPARQDAIGAECPARKATSQPRNSRNTNAVMSEGAGEPTRPPPASTSSIAAARTVGYRPHLFRVAACAATDLALIDRNVGALCCAGVDLTRATDGLLLVVELQPLRDPAG